MLCLHLQKRPSSLPTARRALKVGTCLKRYCGAVFDMELALCSVRCKEVAKMKATRVDKILTAKVCAQGWCKTPKKFLSVLGEARTHDLWMAKTVTNLFICIDMRPTL